jgi:hypothetical protein
MKSLLSLLILLGLVGAMGCGSTDIPTNTNTGNLPFGLMIPSNRPSADYHAVSGVSTRMVSTKVGDSIVESPQMLFYAQFTTSPIAPAVQTVTLNTFPFDHHMNTDTLRLARAGSSNIYGDNTWEVIDSSNTKATYLMPKIDIIDTVGPFDQRSTVRGDTDLVLRWKRPTLGSSAFHIYWKTPNKTYEQVVADYPGTYQIPKSEIIKLRGRGQVVLTRYYYLPQKFKNRTVMITRIAQRSFNVEVL